MRALRPVIALACLALPAAPVPAADRPAAQAIGYSPDARYFAFEQFGIEDGSGFPFADVFVLDLQTDTWVKGSPARVKIEQESETASPLPALKRARALAEPVLRDLHIEEPAELLAAFPGTQPVADRRRIEFDEFNGALGGYAINPTAGFPPRWSLVLTRTEVPRPAACGSDEIPVVGFRLEVDRGLGHAAPVHADTSLPDSRGCPLDYDIAAVYAPAVDRARDGMVALIAVYSQGFEGRDRRYLAVPISAK